MGTSLAEVLRHFETPYLEQHRLSTAQARVWRAVVSCRTPALGGRHQQCDGCAREQWLFNSCRNRHCPQCQNDARDIWRQDRLAELLPVPYCHLVFTLPHALNALALWHPRWVYRTLMQCTAATLTEFAANPRWLGATGAFTLVLHTWTQDLRLHLHVHAVMACGGLDALGAWVAPKRSATFLFPVHALSKVFRAKFIAALRRAQDCGELDHDPSHTPHAADKTRQARLRELTRHDWVVYAKTPLGGPEVVLDYLSRLLVPLHTAWPSRMSALWASPTTQCICGCALTIRAANAPSHSTGLPSSPASCSTCCPVASSASATTACSALH